MSATSPGSLPQVGLGDSERWEESGRERPAWTILEPCWSSLKRLERSWNTWTLETCWIHVGYMLDFVRARTHIEPMTPTPKIFFCEPPLGQDHPSQMSPYRVEPFPPWSRGSRGSCGPTAPGRSGSRTRRSWRWRVQHASPVIPLKQKILETAARKKSHITENST